MDITDRIEPRLEQPPIHTLVPSHTIHLCGSGMAQVISSASGRIQITTGRLAALAILARDAVRPREVAPARGTSLAWTWTDLLALTGVAVGVSGPHRLVLAFCPALETTLSWEREGETTVLPRVLVPAHMIALHTRDGSYVRAGIYLIRPEARLSLSATACLSPWPFGNVYSEHGLICWGQVPHSDLRSVEDVRTVFFNTPFNQDLWAVVGSAARTLPDLVTACRPRMRGISDPTGVAVLQCDTARLSALGVSSVIDAVGRA